MEHNGSQTIHVSFPIAGDCGFLLPRSSRPYNDEDQGEDIRQGFDPSKIPAVQSEFAVGDEDDEDEEAGRNKQNHHCGDLDDRDVWGSRDDDGKH